MKRLSILTAVWLVAVIWTVAPQTQSLISEAPTGFDNLSNGFVPQPEFDAALEPFAEQEPIADGLGPVYNAQSCGECHQNPVVGSRSQIGEQRAGTYKKGMFTDHAGGSLIHSRAIDATIQEHILDANVLTFRTSLSVLGDGFVEAIDDATLQAIAAEQLQVTNGEVQGQVLMVPVSEASNVLRAGR